MENNYPLKLVHRVEFRHEEVILCADSVVGTVTGSNPQNALQASARSSARTEAGRSRPGTLQGEAANWEAVSGEHHAQAMGKHQQHSLMVLSLCIEHLLSYPFPPRATDLRGGWKAPGVHEHSNS